MTNEDQYKNAIEAYKEKIRDMEMSVAYKNGQIAAMIEVVKLLKDDSE